MSNLINRKEAINELCEMVKDCFDADAELIDAIKTTINELPSAEDVSREDYHNLLTALDDVDRALRQYQAKDENQSTDDNWIPVTEKLPDNAEDVLACTRSGWIVIASYRKYNDQWLAFGVRDVVAWMPLPKRYREDGEK